MVRDFLGLGSPGSFQENPHCPQSVFLGNVRGQGGGVGKNIRVGGILRCRSLTLKSRQSRQVRADAMSPLVTPSFSHQAPGEAGTDPARLRTNLPASM